MNKIVLLGLNLFCFTSAILAQWHDQVWVTGVKYTPTAALPHITGSNVLDFGTTPLVIEEYLQQRYTCYNHCLSISDSSGQIQFHFNSIEVFDKNFNLMENGSGINLWANNDSYTPNLKNMFILPLSDKKYMIIHQPITGVNSSPNIVVSDSVFYTLVDMKKNGGLGKVVKKNELIDLGEFSVSLEATKHANGKDWWLFFSPRFENKMNRVLISDNGEVGNVIVQEDIGYMGDKEYPGFVYLYLSGSGEKMILFNRHKGFAIWDVDRCSGELYNEQIYEVEDNYSGNGIFSPDSRYFYFLRRIISSPLDYEFFQINMKKPIFELGQPLFILHEYQEPTWNTHTYYGWLQGTPDGRIFQMGGYINHRDSINGFYKYNQIQFPSRQGMGCNYKEGYEAIKLPNFIASGIPYYPNYRLGPIDGSPCDTLGIDNHPLAHFRWDIEDTLAPYTVTFTDLAAYEPATWSWDFGDPASGAANMSSDTSPVHVFSGAGV